MKQYIELLLDIVNNGTEKPAARENMPGTLSLFGKQLDEIDLSEGFPLLTTKEINFKHIVVELLWFLKGDTHVKYLNDHGVKIWNEDAYAYYCKTLKYIGCTVNEIISYKEFIEKINNCEIEPYTNKPYGSCGQQYGAQWRDFNGNTDQLAELIKGLKNNPESRRHIITAWNPSELEDLALHPCHSMVQFNCRPLTKKERMDWAYNKIKNDPNRQDILSYTQPDQEGAPKYYLDCKMYQRSADVFLGVPYNIASYALLTHILANMCNMIPGKYTHTFGDVHIYDNHIEQVKEQINRDPRELPTLKINDVAQHSTVEDITHWIPEMFELENYNPDKKIKAKLSTGIIK